MTQVTIERERLVQWRHVLAGCTAIHRLHDDDLDDVKAQIDAALQAAPAQHVNQALVEALKAVRPADSLSESRLRLALSIFAQAQAQQT